MLTYQQTSRKVGAWNALQEPTQAQLGLHTHAQANALLITRALLVPRQQASAIWRIG